MNLSNQFAHFLKKHCSPVRPVLLALSGGPDSTALFYLLLKYRQLFGIAHVNHHWRPESTEEAALLKQLADKHGVPFHLKELTPEHTGNLEARCRDARLQFFSEVCQQHGYQAVLLGHHADDQAETVLKRVLEGAELANLRALQPVSKMLNVDLWRPLLNVNKKQILEWLSKQGISWFHDKTNDDSKYLRARFRQKIIPELAHSFGKSISLNLCKLASDTQELKAYLSEIIEPALDCMQKNKFGVRLDMNDFPASPFLMKHLLRELCRRENFILTKSLVETACDLLLSNKFNRSLHIQGRTIFIHGKQIIIFEKASIPHNWKGKDVLQSFIVKK